MWVDRVPSLTLPDERTLGGHADHDDAEKGEGLYSPNRSCETGIYTDVTQNNCRVTVI